MRITKALAIIAGLASGVATQAQAANTFTYTNYSVLDGTGVSGASAVITDPALGVDVDAFVGMIALTGPSGTLDAYCVDILDELQGAATYNITTASAYPKLTAAQIATISALIANGSDYSAVQFAIWETEYGVAVSFSGDPTDQAVATTYLADVTSGAWGAPSNQVLSEITPSVAGANQNLVFSSPVPEPSTLVLLGAALFSVGYVTRRKA
jgi:hypothetical protein